MAGCFDAMVSFMLGKLCAKKAAPQLRRRMRNEYTVYLDGEWMQENLSDLFCSG